MCCDFRDQRDGDFVARYLADGVYIGTGLAVGSTTVDVDGDVAVADDDCGVDWHLTWIDLVGFQPCVDVGGRGVGVEVSPAAAWSGLPGVAHVGYGNIPAAVWQRGCFGWRQTCH